MQVSILCISCCVSNATMCTGSDITVIIVARGKQSDRVSEQGAGRARGVAPTMIRYHPCPFFIVGAMPRARPAPYWPAFLSHVTFHIAYACRTRKKWAHRVHVQVYCFYT